MKFRQGSKRILFVSDIGKTKMKFYLMSFNGYIFHFKDPIQHTEKEIFRKILKIEALGYHLIY